VEFQQARAKSQQTSAETHQTSAGSHQTSAMTSAESHQASAESQQTSAESQQTGAESQQGTFGGIRRKPWGNRAELPRNLDRDFCFRAFLAFLVEGASLFSKSL
jgi:hypothetical protein